MPKRAQKKSSDTEAEKARSDVRLSIRWKLMLLMTIFVITMVAFLTWVQITSQKRLLEEELSKRVELMKQNLIERGKSQIATLAQQVENQIAGFNFSGAMEAIDSAVRAAPEVCCGLLVNTSGLVVVQTGQDRAATQAPAPEWIEKVLERREATVLETPVEGLPGVEIFYPIQVSTAPWGVLKLAFSLSPLSQEIDRSRQQIGLEIDGMIFKSILTSLLFLLPSFVIVYILATGFSRPLIELADMARRLSMGDFSAAAHIRARSRDEVGMLSANFIRMSRDLEASYEKLAEYNRTLEQKVAQRTDALNRTLRRVEEANRQIMDGIRYAEMIQRSLLPNIDEVQRRLPDSFFIWIPRDVVGGDIFFVDFLNAPAADPVPAVPASDPGETAAEAAETGGRFIIAALDCTGHGVPGAFMTMIASSGLRRILRDDRFHDPSRILRQLNLLVKTTLHQDTRYALSDDGLDAAVCYVDLDRPGGPRLVFAGARLPLYVESGGRVRLIKGDRMSIGYKRSDMDYDFTNHAMDIREETTFYLATDGFTDQLGGPQDRRLGTRKLRALLAAVAGRPMAEAARLANAAAGIVVGKVGTATVTPEELQAALAPPLSRADKYRSPARLAALAERLRRENRRIVFTNGCFDLLHAGHVLLFSASKRLGDTLIVAIDDDAAVGKLKGPGRPVIGQAERARMLGALDSVDYVTVFSEGELEGLIEAIRPDVLTKGDNTPESEIAGREILARYGGRIERVPILENLSASGIIDHIRNRQTRPSASGAASADSGGAS